MMTGEASLLRSTDSTPGGVESGCTGADQAATEAPRSLAAAMPTRYCRDALMPAMLVDCSPRGTTTVLTAGAPASSGGQRFDAHAYSHTVYLSDVTSAPPPDAHCAHDTNTAPTAGWTVRFRGALGRTKACASGARATTPAAPTLLRARRDTLYTLPATNSFVRTDICPSST